jgi:type III secretion protein V
MNAVLGLFQKLALLASKRNDVVLAVMLVAIIFMMILPLPVLLVDILIALNMTISGVLLMVAMYLPSPLAFSSFPSVLLVTTLFRLGISIATTRLILLQGDAGSIITTFGNFVVGGNLVVGLVVFLILTIVQFVVITKGAERVAEVAARFSLDAMPGKQMSIDGDMRAGTIDMEEAKRRRNIVEKESQLYGSMDGAMKFVKGDAIAGLIIVTVNLLGGMLIGVLQKNLSAAKAVQTYSILSIGDGLIAQIPALFISICAGIMVTRVQSEEGGLSNVGRDIGNQIMAQPRALLIGGAIALGMGLIPGMPKAVFITLAVFLIALGIGLQPRKQINATTGEVTEVSALQASGATQPKPRNDGTDEFVPTVPLILDVSQDLRDGLDASSLNDELMRIRRALYFDLGVPFPGIHLRFSDNITPQSYHILLSEVPVATGLIKPGRVMVRESEDALNALRLTFEKDRGFLPGTTDSLWVKADLMDLLTNAGMSVMDASQILTYHLAGVLRKYSADFIGVQETKFLLSAMEQRFPDLVKEALRVMPTQKIGEILQRLVSEDISVRDLRTILEALVEWGQKEKDSVLLTEYVRGALKRHISFKYASSQNMLPAYLLAPNVEETIRSAVRQTSAGSYLALDPAVGKRLVENVRKTVGDLPASGQRPVLLASMDIRRYLRKLIEQDLHDLQVISYQELTTEVNIQPLARIDL